MTRIYGKLKRITTNQLYFPEIDGIRFLAITLVVLYHIHGYFMEKFLLSASYDNAFTRLTHTFFRHGDRGVELFFVLSGFILCLPFAHHYINNGRDVSLKKYYLRRVTRLEPPYIVAMTGLYLICLLMRLYTPGQLTPHWLASLAYLHNIIYQQPSILTVVAWSLEVEIQFYLIAPLLFRLLALPPITRRSIFIAGIAGFVYFQYLFPQSVLSILKFAQYFFAGILLADFYVSDAAPGFFNRRWVPLAALAALISILFLHINKHRQLHELFVGQFIFPYLIGLLYYAILKNDVLKRIFSYKFIPVIGGMCYSIYLLHYTIISIFGRVTLRLHITSLYLPNLFLQIILLSVPILVISGLYYYYIERPFMSAKWLNMMLKKDKKAEGVNAVL